MGRFTALGLCLPLLLLPHARCVVFCDCISPTTRPEAFTRLSCYSTSRALLSFRPLHLDRWNFGMDMPFTSVPHLPIGGARTISLSLQLFLPRASNARLTLTLTCLPRSWWWRDLRLVSPRYSSTHAHRLTLPAHVSRLLAATAARFYPARSRVPTSTAFHVLLPHSGRCVGYASHFAEDGVTFARAFYAYRT